MPKEIAVEPLIPSTTAPLFNIACLPSLALDSGQSLARMTITSTELSHFRQEARSKVQEKQIAWPGNNYYRCRTFRRDAKHHRAFVRQFNALMDWPDVILDAKQRITG